MCSVIMEHPQPYSKKLKSRIMRLITHNMLKSNIKGVENGYPLGIEVVKIEEQELDFNAGREYHRTALCGRH